MIITQRSLRPQDLYDAPELASVDALRAVLDVTLAAILAANPELHLDECMEGRTTAPAQVWVAETLLRDAETLRATLERYRHVVEAQPYLTAARLDDDISF